MPDCNVAPYLKLFDKVFLEFPISFKGWTHSVLGGSRRTESATRELVDRLDQVQHFLRMGEAHPSGPPTGDQMSLRKALKSNQRCAHNLRQNRCGCRGRVETQFAVNLVGDHQNVVALRQLKQLPDSLVRDNLSRGIVGIN